MTDDPADHMDPSGARSHARVATEEWAAPVTDHDSGDGPSADVDDATGNGAAHLRRGPRRRGDDRADGTGRPPRRAVGGRAPADAVTGRVHVTWRHALAAGVACFVVWLVLDGPTLLRSAQDAPLGARRTVAIDVLRPIADVSNALGLGHVVGGANRLIGRTGTAGGGVLQIEGVPVHHHRVVTAPHVVTPSTVPPPVPGASSSSVPAPSSTTTVTAPDGLMPLAVPTQSAPLRLLVTGDSLGIDFGQPLVNDLAATDVVSAVLDGHIDTGLARSDYFDWQPELQRDITQYQPQAVVVFIGANDPQNFVDGSASLSYGSPAWNAAYTKRVGNFMTAATSAGRASCGWGCRPWPIPPSMPRWRI